MGAVPDRVQQLGEELVDAVAQWVNRSAETGVVLVAVGPCRTVTVGSIASATIGGIR